MRTLIRIFSFTRIYKIVLSTIKIASLHRNSGYAENLNKKVSL